ncbi:MAG: polyribonucleotide nucleotidyltransferase [Candidatus Latescibacteria bacterium]|nr:polyribonucleotide nucleotidyltransferase [Candidatus Latescibacterota bacterium]
MSKQVSKVIGDNTLTLETGKLAKQADGSVVVQYGESIVLATVCYSKDVGVERDFLPLTVEYREKTYAIGRIPGNFFRREGRPNAKEILSARQIDRPLRPLFPKGFTHEIQIIVRILSSDKENDQDILGLIGASTACSLSGLPIEKIVSAVRVGYLNGEYIINPTFQQREECDLDIVVAGSDHNILMVEGSAFEVAEDIVVGALEFAKPHIKEICDMQREICDGLSKPTMEYQAVAPEDEMISDILNGYSKAIEDAVVIPEKSARRNKLASILEECLKALEEKYPENEFRLKQAFAGAQKKIVRNLILDKKQRIDGRTPDDIRDISCEIGVLPRAHGSAIFTRGQTQSLGVVALGTKLDERMIDDLEGTSFKSYMLDYNFLPFSVGEVRRMFGTSRREIGHGNLAEQAISPVIPSDEIFPYTIRIVSDILESNGSSSMATVCSGSLCLMDAGVPIKTAVAGIAMGLIKDGDRYVVLTDILGDEDHLGDMDFKVTGTSEGITAFQMDIKIDGITTEIMTEALSKAKQAREHILGIMNATIDAPRENLSKYAPRIISITVPVDKIGLVIGPGGKMIKGIQEETGTVINIDDDGTVLISSEEGEGGELARKKIEALVVDPEIGSVYEGPVRRITSFGAFVEILPGKDGMVHISEMENRRIKRIEDVVKVGDIVKVKVINIDNQGKVKLSRKAVLNEESGKGSHGDNSQ